MYIDRSDGGHDSFICIPGEAAGKRIVIDKQFFRAVSVLL